MDSLPPLGILITGAGAPGIAGTLFALRNNPAQRKLRIFGVDVSPHAVGRHLLDGFGLLPYPEDKSYLEALATFCHREKLTLILPQTTREVAVLSAAKKEMNAEGIKVIVADAEAVELSNNKYEVMKIFQKLDLPVAPFRLTHSQEELRVAARELGYPDRPVAVKPPLSNGMRGFRTLTSKPLSRNDFLNCKPSGTEITLEALLNMDLQGEKWPQLLIMEYLSGLEYSVDAFLGDGGGLAVARRRDQIRSGISFRTTVENREDLSSASLRVAGEVGLKYAFGFQYKLDDSGQPKVLECNPRVQGTMIATALAGVNCPWLAVEEAMGDEPVVSSLQAEEGHEFCRYWGGVGHKDNQNVSDISPFHENF